MKKKHVEKLWKGLLPHLSGYSCKGSLLTSQPTKHILRGFYCEDSSFDPTVFCLYVFFLPLYVPTTHLAFYFGKRLEDARGCEKWWNVNEPSLSQELLQAITTQGSTFLLGTETPSGLVQVAQQRYGASRDPYVWQAIAFSLIMEHRHADALVALDYLLNLLNPDISWQQELIERTHHLKQSMTVDPQSARQLLAEWELDTRRNLQLDEPCGNGSAPT